MTTFSATPGPDVAAVNAAWDGMAQDHATEIERLRAALEKAAGRLMWCAGILPSERARDLASEWADDARAAIKQSAPHTADPVPADRAP